MRWAGWDVTLARALEKIMALQGFGGKWNLGRFDLVWGMICERGMK